MYSIINKHSDIQLLPLAYGKIMFGLCFRSIFILLYYKRLYDVISRGKIDLRFDSQIAKHREARSKGNE